jgi:hypothetical protein
MEEKGEKLRQKSRRGRPPKHGGYSLLTRGELPENRKHIREYLTAVRENLIRDMGPLEKELTTAQIIIIDRIISKLGIVRCIEEHIKENTVIVGQNLAPSLRASYLAYNNSIRLDLQALGIEKKYDSSDENLKEYLEQKAKIG